MLSPIMVWSFYDAPEEFQRLSEHGGEEDWLAFVPSGEDCPNWAVSGTPFGVSEVSTHHVEGGIVLIGAHS